MSDNKDIGEGSFSGTPPQNLKNETLGGFFWLFGGSGSQAVLQIIVLSILARLVTPYEFGVIGIALIVIRFSRIFSQMGMGPALVQRPELTQAHIRTGFTSSLLLGGFFALTLIASAPYVAAFFEMPELTAVLKVIALIFIIDSFVVVSQSLLQRKLKLKLYALAEVISYAIGYSTVGITLAYLGFGVWALVYARLGQVLIRSVIVSYLEPHSVIPYWNHKAFKELFYFGSGYTIAKIANYLAGQGDNLVVGKLLGADALGFYSRAYQIMVAPAALIGGSLDTALFPAMSTVQKNKKKLQNAFLRSIELIALASLPASAVIIVNAPEIVLVLLGENWTDVIFPLQILGAGMLFRVSYKISDSLARALGVVYKRAWRQIVYATAIFIGAYVGSYWNIDGVAVGVTIAIVVNFLLMAHLSLKELGTGWSPFFERHSRALALSIITLVVSLAAITQLRIYIESVFIRESVFLVFITGFLLSAFYYFRTFLRIEQEVSDITCQTKRYFRKMRKVA